MKISNDLLHELRLLYSALSNGQRSTLTAAIRETNSQIGTTTDSRNYAFLRKLTDHGLAEELSLGVDLPVNAGGQLTSFRLSHDAATLIEYLRSR